MVGKMAPCFKPFLTIFVLLLVFFNFVSAVDADFFIIPIDQQTGAQRTPVMATLAGVRVTTGNGFVLCHRKSAALAGTTYIYPTYYYADGRTLGPSGWNSDFSGTAELCNTASRTLSSRLSQTGEFNGHRLRFSASGAYVIKYPVSFSGSSDANVLKITVDVGGRSSAPVQRSVASPSPRARRAEVSPSSRAGVRASPTPDRTQLRPGKAASRKIPGLTLYSLDKVQISFDSPAGADSEIAEFLQQEFSGRLLFEDGGVKIKSYVVEEAQSFSSIELKQDNMLEVVTGCAECPDQMELTKELLAFVLAEDRESEALEEALAAGGGCRIAEDDEQNALKLKITCGRPGEELDPARAECGDAFKIAAIPGVFDGNAETDKVSLTARLKPFAQNNNPKLYDAPVRFVVGLVPLTSEGNPAAQDSLSTIVFTRTTTVSAQGTKRNSRETRTTASHLP